MSSVFLYESTTLVYPKEKLIGVALLVSFSCLLVDSVEDDDGMPASHRKMEYIIQWTTKAMTTRTIKKNEIVFKEKGRKNVMAPFVSLEFLRRLAYFNMQIEKLLIHDSLILGIPATSLHRWRTLKGEFFSDVLKLHFQKKEFRILHVCFK